MASNFSTYPEEDEINTKQDMKNASCDSIIKTEYESCISPNLICSEESETSKIYAKNLVEELDTKQALQTQQIFTG